jgi:ribosomal protein L5
MNRLQKFYDNIICFDLLFKDHYFNIMELPQLNQITFNTGLGLKAILDKKQLLFALLNMELISGQRPLVTRAKKSIDKFKLHENMPVGCKVTLRKNLKYIFLDRFINIVIPSIDISNELFIKKNLFQQNKEQFFHMHAIENSINKTTPVFISHIPNVFNSESSIPIFFYFNFYQTCLPFLRSKF